MRFCHKYGMSVALKTQAKDLQQPLDNMLSSSGCDSLAHPRVVQVARGVEGFGCMSLLHLCEAYFVRNFRMILAGDKRFLNKLSSDSMARVYQGVIHEQELSMQAMRDALNESVHETTLLCKTGCCRGISCPRCDAGIETSNKKSAVHVNRGSTCTWPWQHTHETLWPSLSDLAANITKSQHLPSSQ